MIYITNHLYQEKKTGYTVCGDICLCERTERGTVYVMCDGIGSGVYANVAAITCAERIMEHLRLGISLRNSSEIVADSMHRARTENIPFSAFTVIAVIPDGQFTAYSYEMPPPIFMKDGTALRLSPQFHTSHFEVIGEFNGCFKPGDVLLLASDGITQSGMGNGKGLGIGYEGLVEFINKNVYDSINVLAENILQYCKSLSGDKFEDDTTLALLQCCEPKELTLLTGPPSKRHLNPEYARNLTKSTGKKVICGSTTLDIISEQLGIPVEPVISKNTAGMPPEYFMEGIDIATEGAITLSQVCNILDEPVEQMEGNSYVKRLCILLREADIIYMHVGTAINSAHEGLFFKQLGVRVRRTVVRTIEKKLQAMGKLVIIKSY